MTLRAPFPYFGGKSAIAPMVWQALGDVPNYIEPFFGSGACLLARPAYRPADHLETVNDVDGMVANFWRAVRLAPGHVARWADWPVNENDLHARHAWLVGQKPRIVERLEGDPDWYDAKAAGWWVWGMGCWIGSGFCSGKGPWQVEDGRLVHLGNRGRGIQRKLVHLGGGRGIQRKLVHLGDGGMGIQRQLVHLDGEDGLLAWFQALSERLRRVRVCCGDWQRICGPSPTIHRGLTGVFLDPPYGHEVGRNLVYAEEQDVTARVEAWCQEWGAHPLMRIVLCGYEGEYCSLEGLGWRVQAWQAHGGYGLQGQGRGRDNATRERLWLSPQCLRPEYEQLGLFGA